jgi:UDP-N-acetylglucosamine 2-epimerase (non-hydrolysing)
MKVAPVHRALAELDPALELLVVHTGQHYDPEMSDVFLRELEMPSVDVFLGVGSGSHAEQTARALLGLETVLLERDPTALVVAGDVNSTLAAALAAVKLDVPIVHIESGLRSHDPAMPEEHNRRITDHLSSVLLAHSPDAVENLYREGIDTSLVHLVGNTMIDSLLGHLEAARDRRPWETFELAPREYGLVTLHRPTLVDSAATLTEAAHALVELARTFPLIFPVHPRTLARLDEQGLVGTLEASGVILCAPLGYLAFLGLEAEARFVVTDSGGVQEETSALGTPCFTLRRSTERPITIERGTNLLLGPRPERIAEIPDLLNEEYEANPIPLWDGRAGTRAAAVISSYLATGARVQIGARFGD